MRALTGLSQTEIANVLGVKRATVARWEGAENTPIPGPADRLLRLVSTRLIWTSGETEELEILIDMLSQIANEKPVPITMTYLPDALGREESMFPNHDKSDDGWTLANTG